MGYDKENLEKLSIAAIKKHSLTRIQHIISYLPCVSATFYNFELEKLETIKEALFINREKKKKKLTDRWEKSENPTLQIAAFKLLADEDELLILNSQAMRLDVNNVSDKVKSVYDALQQEPDISKSEP